MWEAGLLDGEGDLDLLPDDLPEDLLSGDLLGNGGLKLLSGECLYFLDDLLTPCLIIS